MKTFKLINVFFSAVLFIHGSISAQDLLYKKDSTILKADIVSADQKTVTYKTPGQSMDILHYMSKTVIDSIIFNDGRTLRFQNQELPLQQEIKRNYFGIDFFNTFFNIEVDFIIGLNNLHLSYERIFATGDKSLWVELLFNLNSDENTYGWDGSLIFLNDLHFSYDSYYFFTKVGFNYYPFNYSLIKTGNFRSFTGVSLMVGSIKKDVFSDLISKAFIASVVWNIDGRWYLSDVIQVSFGTELSVFPFLVFCSPEIGLSIGF